MVVRSLLRSRSRLTGWVVACSALLVPPATLALLHRFPRFDLVFESVDFHLAAVGGISACAYGVALSAAVAARRTAQGALVVLASGCLAVGGFMLAHGLTTPGTLGRPFNLWVSRFPALAVAAFAICLGVAAMRPDGRLLAAAARTPLKVIGGAGGLVVAASLPAVLWPEAGIGAVALAGESAARTAVLAASALGLLAAGLVHLQRWQLGHDWVQLALVVASWQGAGAALSLELGQLWHLAWWDYHVFLLTGFAAAVYAIWIGSGRGRAVDDTLGSVFVTDPLQHIERGYSDALRALVGAVEARDHYTHGHSARVAEWSVRLGQRMGLRTPQLRMLAEGAYLHDVGKIGVPDHVLNKPGALTAEERHWIEQHPDVGVDIAGRALSLRSTLDMIRHHHERYDGGGYPDGLAGEGIPLLARVVAVADVWDALTSERAYRPAWTQARALDHLVAGRGSHFDPACLDAFVHLLAGHGIRPDERSARVGHAVGAQACHHHAHVSRA